MGDPTLGVINSFHYSAAHDSPENKAFLKAYVETNGTKLRPNFMACAGYDGMAAIAEALKKTGGSVDAEKFVAALKGMRLMSPRGPIMIDPETRDIVQTCTSVASKKSTVCSTTSSSTSTLTSRIRANRTRASG
jgi:branched-chain amino acid transport system substrate-binding protein